MLDDLRSHAVAEAQVEDDWAVRVALDLEGLGWLAPATIQRRRYRAQPDPLVVASGERQQGVDQLLAVQL